MKWVNGILILVPYSTGAVVGYLIPMRFLWVGGGSTWETAIFAGDMLDILKILRISVPSQKWMYP